MKVALSTATCQKIADVALRNAREYAAVERGWRSADRLHTFAAPGEVGIKSEVRYLLYQDKGTKPFLMLSLEGKTIPMKDNNGNTHLMKVVGVGQPGWVNIPENSNKYGATNFASNASAPGRVYRQQKWRHPGINPTNFIRNSISRAIDSSGQIIKDSLKEILGE